MKAIILILGLSVASVSSASDYWDYCSDASGSVKMEHGSLYVDGDKIAFESFQTLSVVKKESENCVIEQTGDTMLAYENTTSVAEVRYKYMSTTQISKSTLICEQGGSGIPAAWNCVDDNKTAE